MWCSSFALTNEKQETWWNKWYIQQSASWPHSDGSNSSSTNSYVQLNKNQTRLPLLPSVTLLFASLMCVTTCVCVFFSTGNQGGLSKYNKKEKRQRGEPWKTARLRANEVRHFPVTWPLDLLIKRVSAKAILFSRLSTSPRCIERLLCAHTSLGQVALFRRAVASSAADAAAVPRYRPV